MNAATLLAALRRRGLTVEPNGDRVHVMPRRRIADADRAAIRSHKPALAALLIAEADAAALDRPDAVLGDDGAVSEPVNLSPPDPAKWRTVERHVFGPPARQVLVTVESRKDDAA